MINNAEEINDAGKRKAKIAVVTSGKGGVGKTTTSASLATGLALEGHRTVVIDFDIGLRNLDLIMGCERRVVYDFVNVIQGEATLNQALIQDKHVDNLFILAASQTRDKDVLTKESVGKVFDQLKPQFDFIICDSPAGIEQGATMAMYFADIAIIVTNPEVSSVRDSDRMLGLLSSKTFQAEQGGHIDEYLVITRHSNKRVSSGDMLSITDIQELLGVTLLGVIPESTTVLTASNAGVPVIRDPKSEAGYAYQQVVERFLGKRRPFDPSELQSKNKSFLKRLFGAKREETV